MTSTGVAEVVRRRGSALGEGTREGVLDLLSAQCGETGAALPFASHDTRLGARFDRRVSIAELNRHDLEGGAEVARRRSPAPARSG